MADNKETIRTRIVERLSELDLSMRKASLDAGLGETAVRDLLRNPDQTPSMKTVIKLARALETTVDWLIHGEERVQFDREKMEEHFIVEAWARLSLSSRMALRKSILAHLIMDAAYGEFWDIGMGFEEIRSLPKTPEEADALRRSADELRKKLTDDEVSSEAFMALASERLRNREKAAEAATQKPKDKAPEDSGNAVRVEIDTEDSEA